MSRVNIKFVSASTATDDNFFDRSSEDTVTRFYREKPNSSTEPVSLRTVEPLHSGRA
jgi:hypothetical protein